MSLGLKTPATVVQIRGIIVNAGLLAGVLALVTIYDLRRGAAQDLHRLEFNGMISRKVANALCHSYLSWKEGVTDEYIGDDVEALTNGSSTYSRSIRFPHSEYTSEDTENS